MRKGSKGPNVERWQAFLRTHGFEGQDHQPLKIDGDYGANTEWATHEFQRLYHLTIGEMNDQTRIFAAAMGFKLATEEDDTDPDILVHTKWTDWHTHPKPVGLTDKEPVFGDGFSRMCDSGSKNLGVDVLWTFELFGYESGFDPLRENDIGARGLWQKLKVRLADGTYFKYQVTDPAKQVADYFLRATDLRRKLGFSELPTRGHYYCLNLAPARLQGGKATPETVVYSLTHDRSNFIANHYLAKPFPAGYVGGSFTGPDGVKRVDFFTIADLDAPLLKASRWFPNRFTRELAAVRSLG